MKTILLVIAICIMSCNTQSTTHNVVGEHDPVVTDTSSFGSASTIDYTDEAYNKIEVVFEGNPDKNKVQPMLESVMKQYKMPITNDNVLHVANALLVMKKNSKVGVTEMDVLKYVYQHPTSDTSLANAIGMAAGILEYTK